MVKIFLDVGHHFGARSGAFGNDIQEEEYNLEVMKRVKEIWDTRVSMDNLLSRLPGILKTLVFSNLYNTVPYYLVVSNETPPVLCGTYKERLEQAKEIEIDAHIQMHLNAGGGKYALIGYNSDHREYRGKSEKLAEIAAKVMNEVFDSESTGELISKIKIVACSDHSDEQYEKNIAYCLRHSPCSSILMEPFFLDYKVHADFLKSEEGKDAMVRFYVKLLEKIGKELST